MNEYPDKLMSIFSRESGSTETDDTEGRCDHGWVVEEHLGTKIIRELAPDSDGLRYLIAPQARVECYSCGASHVATDRNKVEVRRISFDSTGEIKDTDSVDDEGYRITLSSGMHKHTVDATPVKEKQKRLSDFE